MVTPFEDETYCHIYRHQRDVWQFKKESCNVEYVEESLVERYECNLEEPDDDFYDFMDQCHHEHLGNMSRQSSPPPLYKLPSWANYPKIRVIIGEQSFTPSTQQQLDIIRLEAHMHFLEALIRKEVYWDFAQFLS